VKRAQRSLLYVSGAQTVAATLQIHDARLLQILASA
jgi:hypothetical protein